MKYITLILVLLISILSSYGQGILSNQLKDSNASCGSHDYMENINIHNPGFMEKSNELMKELSKQTRNSNHRRTEKEEYEIKVVFHVVYNNDEENIHDTVIKNQLTLINACFGRNNEDTVNMRPVFKDIAGNPNIQFKLAELDPYGDPTTGIVHTKTNVEYFGGILPYAQNQQTEIVKWVNDSLYKNLGRLSNSILGGSGPWDKTQYLNIWIGDLRILEPKLNNFEELFLLGIATPPENLENWTGAGELDNIFRDLDDGVYLHYKVVGPNNPAKFKAPYNGYNGITTEGKILVHEIGHYLGLRHIWGDGDCSKDDFLHDTPRSDNSSQFGCNKNLNSCLDTIEGVDLPNMIENFMDYSSSKCQNTFTKQQSNLMRKIVSERRGPLVSFKEISSSKLIIYPNPSKGQLNIDGISSSKEVVFILEDYQGRQVFHSISNGNSNYQINLSFLNNGVYFLRILEGDKINVRRVIKM